MLKRTPSLKIEETTHDQSKSKLPCIVSGFRDFPDGDRNKKFWYRVKDFNHAIDLLDRLKANGQYIRAAFYTNEKGVNNRIPL